MNQRIDIANETLLLPAKATKRVGDVHVSTVVRWMATGVAGGSIKLESVKIGGKRYTSVEALERFAERCTTPDAEASSRSTRQRDQAAANAGDELAAMGV